MRSESLDRSRPSPRRLLLVAAGLALLWPGLARAAEPLSALDVARLRSVSEVAVSPAGDRIAYLLDVPRRPFEEEDGETWTELHVIGADGESRPYVTGQVELSDLAWRPGGAEISFVAERGDDEHDAVYAIPVDGGESRRLVSHPADVKSYSWSPDGRRLAFVAEAEAPDAEQREELEEHGFKQQVFEEEWLPRKVWIAAFDEEATAPRALDLPGSASELHWSPDGSRLAVALAPTSMVDDEYMRRKLQVVDVESGAIAATVENPGKLGAVAWSPDGDRLAFISAADLHDPMEGRLMAAEAAGGEPRELVPGLEGHVSAFGWIDAASVAFVADEGVRTTLNRVGLEAGDRRVLLGGEGPAWSDLGLTRDGAVAALIGSTPSHPAEVFRLALSEAQAQRLTVSNPWLEERRLASQEVVRYRARDGLELEGLLIRPSAEPPEGGYPLVMIVHGGPEAHFRHGWLTNYSRPGQVLAGMGIAAFYPNYRGSTGRGVGFSKLSQGDPAGKEFDDLIDAVDHLVASGLVNAERVGVTGGSYGGYATAWSATRFSDRFAAGVMFVGISDKVSKLATSDIPNELYLVHARSWPWENWQFFLERSPIFYAGQSRTPLLILHGTKDSRVYPGQSLELYRHLKLRGQAPVRLVWYPDEKHGNRRAAARLDYSLRLLRWFEHYLQGPGGEPPDRDLEYPRPAADSGAETG